MAQALLAMELLFPLQTFVFMTFFMRDDQGISSTRIAIGLTLTFLLLLALISLNLPGAEAAPRYASGHKVPEAAGGYAGGGQAWVCCAVGRVAMSFGWLYYCRCCLVCGFSISDMVECFPPG